MDPLEKIFLDFDTNIQIILNEEMRSGIPVNEKEYGNSHQVIEREKMKQIEKLNDTFFKVFTIFEIRFCGAHICCPNYPECYRCTTAEFVDPIETLGRMLFEANTEFRDLVHMIRLRGLYFIDHFPEDYGKWLEKKYEKSAVSFDIDGTNARYNLRETPERKKRAAINFKEYVNSKVDQLRNDHRFKNVEMVLKNMQFDEEHWDEIY